MQMSDITWKTNLEKLPGRSDAIFERNVGIVSWGTDLIPQALSSGDYLTARRTFFSVYEAARQNNVLTNNEWQPLFDDICHKYREFVFNIDPLFKDGIKEIQPILTENPGILQTDLYALLTFSKDDAAYCLKFAELGNFIRRVKKGRSYQLWNL